MAQTGQRVDPPGNFNFLVEIDGITRADRRAEAAMRRILDAQRSGDGVIGEEYGEKPGVTGRQWVLDPIDGTRSFTVGRPIFGTLIALGQPVGQRSDRGDAEHDVQQAFPVAAARGLDVWVGGGRIEAGVQGRLRMQTADDRVAGPPSTRYARRLRHPSPMCVRTPQAGKQRG